MPVVTGEFTDATFAGADMIAISPGVPKDQPPIAAAVARGVELVGDIELFARALPPAQKVLAITGSNGKTTVTALTAALCRAAGLDVVVAGNIGDAVLDALAAYDPGACAWPDVFVLELSSFQLETTSSLEADRRRGAQRYRQPSRPLHGPAGVRGSEGAHLRQCGHPGVEPRRRAVDRDAHSRPAGRIVRRRAFLPEKASGASSASIT